MPGVLRRLLLLCPVDDVARGEDVVVHGGLQGRADLDVVRLVEEVGREEGGVRLGTEGGDLGGCISEGYKERRRVARTTRSVSIVLPFLVVTEVTGPEGML